MFFVQATESPSRRSSSASLPNLSWAIENAGYGGKLEVLLVTCALVLYTASAVAETGKIKTFMGEIVRDSRDYTALWPIEQGPRTPPASWMRERHFVLGRMKALLASPITRKQGGLAPVSRVMLEDYGIPELNSASTISPLLDRPKMTANAIWLEKAQHRPQKGR